MRCFTFFLCETLTLFECLCFFFFSHLFLFFDLTVAFVADEVVAPLTAIYQRVFDRSATSGALTHLTTRDSLEQASASLRRMVVEFNDYGDSDIVGVGVGGGGGSGGSGGGDDGDGGGSSGGSGVNMEFVMRIYEREMKTPLRSLLFGGDLARYV
jgi:hypothetical protein